MIIVFGCSVAVFHVPFGRIFWQCIQIIPAEVWLTMQEDDDRGKHDSSVDPAARLADELNEQNEDMNRCGAKILRDMRIQSWIMIFAITMLLFNLIINNCEF